MKRCRFLPFLILICALDLAMPIAPTSTGVEFEEDEEVVHLNGWRLPRLLAAENQREAAAALPRVVPRVTMTAAPRAVATSRPAHAPRLRLATDPPPAPSSTEDH